MTFKITPRILFLTITGLYAICTAPHLIGILSTGAIMTIVGGISFCIWFIILSILVIFLLAGIIGLLCGDFDDILSFNIRIPHLGLPSFKNSAETEREKLIVKMMEAEKLGDKDEVDRILDLLEKK